MSDRPTVSPAGTGAARRWALAAPLAIFVALAGLFLTRLQSGDASLIPSVLIGRKVPDFALPALDGAGRPALASADLSAGKVTVLNVFASWCAPCHAEHPLLMRLADDPAVRDKGVVLAGLAYKDEPENARRFLGARGNPYARIGVDRNGRAAIDFGVYGVPETFIIRGDGVIAYKFVGQITEEALRETILPEIGKAAR